MLTDNVLTEHHNSLAEGKKKKTKRILKYAKIKYSKMKKQKMN